MITFDKTRFDREKRALNYFADSDYMVIGIRRIFKLVWIAAGTAFSQTFNEPTLSGFDFKMDGGNSDIDMTQSLGSLQSILKQKRRFIFNYKMTCDNKAEKYSDLRARTSRKRFIEKMMEFINSRGLSRKLRIQTIEYKEDGDGKNPRLFIVMRYSYKVVDKKKPGVMKKTHTDINLNFALKYAGSFSNKLDSLKPKDVRPKIVDVWLTPKQLYDNVITFINSDKFPSKNTETKKDYADAVSNSYNNTSLKDNLGIAPDLSSEFFEILSSLKLGKLLLRKDTNIIKTFGFPDGVNISTVQIYIPEAANEALIDYKIAIDGNTENPLRVSVKSKVRGSSVATAKFSDAFANESEVDDWINSIKYAKVVKANQGQKIIAKNALRYKSLGGKAMLYPIGAFVDLSNGPTASSFKADFNKHVETSNMNYEEFKKVAVLLNSRISSINKDKYLDDVITDSDLLMKTKRMLADNVYRFGQGAALKTKKTKDAIDKPVQDAKKIAYGGVYPFTVGNFSLTCERLLVQTSMMRSTSKMNFYKLFYDQILKKESVVYSFNDLDDSGDEVKLSYHYRSARNFNQYKKWISLRTKNYGNNLQDTLGMNL